MNQLSLLPLQTDTFINMYKYTFDPFTSTISLLILLSAIQFLWLEFEEFSIRKYYIIIKLIFSFILINCLLAIVLFLWGVILSWSLEVSFCLKI